MVIEPGRLTVVQDHIVGGLDWANSEGHRGARVPGAT